MIIDQEEINALLDAADELGEEVQPSQAAPAAAGPADSPAGGFARLPNLPELERIRKIRVPVIVRLAERKMTLGEIMGLSPGSIIEFDKSGDAALELMINNQVIGLGSAVKVAENFGLRIEMVGEVTERIRSMGSSR